MDSKFGFVIIDHGRHYKDGQPRRKETRYLVERSGIDEYRYTIYRWKNGDKGFGAGWKNVGAGIAEHVRSYDDFADVIATRLGPSDYEWELIDHNAITY